MFPSKSKVALHMSEECPLIAEDITWTHRVSEEFFNRVMLEGSEEFRKLKILFDIAITCTHCQRMWIRENNHKLPIRKRLLVLDEA